LDIPISTDAGYVVLRTSPNHVVHASSGHRIAQPGRRCKDRGGYSGAPTVTNPDIEATRIAATRVPTPSLP